MTSDCYRIKGFLILVGLFRICLLSRVNICSLYRGILYVWASGLFSFYKDFLISRFFPIHFTVTLVGLKTIVRYIEDFVVSKFVKSRFHCALSCIRPRRPVEFWLHGSSGSY